MKRQRTEPNAESKGHRATPDAASDALAMPSLETITATLSVILHTLNKMQAAMSTMQTEVTDIKETQLSLINAQRHLSNQVCGLQNKTKKFFTQLRDLPLEIIVQIFAWIPVRTVFRYRRLSRTINQCLLTSQFATLNMRSTDFKEPSKNAIDGLWLVVPQSYQTVVARAMVAQGRRIIGDDCRHFKKSLPTSIGYWTAVFEISLENCTIIGSIPDELSSLKNLCFLRLSCNGLTGSLPRSLNLLPHLSCLDVSDNQLSGEFPALPNLDHLTILDISRNCFRGPVPTVFSQSQKLWSVVADHNLFNVIPASISQLTRLGNLSMSGNKFSCEIPPGIWNMTALMSLKMSGCNIFGSLAGVGGLRNLAILDVSNNQLSGEFPSREISNMHRLGSLHVVGNQFSWGEVLDMSENEFKMTMCMDRELQKTYVIREGFHKCREEHGVVPFTGDISDSEFEDYSEDESDIINEED
ncbi:hypothetical protein HDU78_006312 [Chytriomyces hyalinus]|nr:hypothetical protein HDU78_006312 [Chytriomyces hyalinus]